VLPASRLSLEVESSTRRTPKGRARTVSGWLDAVFVHGHSGSLVSRAEWPHVKSVSDAGPTGLSLEVVRNLSGVLIYLNSGHGYDEGLGKLKDANLAVFDLAPIHRSTRIPTTYWWF
jgi:hypothetical protein